MNFYYVDFVRVMVTVRWTEGESRESGRRERNIERIREKNDAEVFILPTTVRSDLSVEDTVILPSNQNVHGQRGRTLAGAIVGRPSFVLKGKSAI